MEMTQKMLASQFWILTWLKQQPRGATVAYFVTLGAIYKCSDLLIYAYTGLYLLSI